MVLLLCPVFSFVRVEGFRCSKQSLLCYLFINYGHLWRAVQVFLKLWDAIRDLE